MHLFEQQNNSKACTVAKFQTSFHQNLPISRARHFSDVWHFYVKTSIITEMSIHALVGIIFYKKTEQ